MDYSHDAYFAGTQPPYHQFPVGITPLTPSNSAGSENFNTSPQNTFEQCPGDQQYQDFDPYASQFHPPSAAFPGVPGPPTPPNQHPGLNGAAGLAFGPTQADGLSITKADSNGESEANARQGSNSEEDDSTPAQTRRKAQNRAAQRAFRERKERHVKELEAKLASLEAAQQETATENEKLKRDLQKISTENEILKATSSINNGGSVGDGANSSEPLEYNPNDFYTRLLAQHQNKTPCHRILTSEKGERLYAAGATWDYIINHDLYKQGLVDIADISNRLKHKAKCDGQGPVFEECTIIEAIEQSVGSGSDQLL